MSSPPPPSPPPPENTGGRRLDVEGPAEELLNDAPARAASVGAFDDLDISTETQAEAEAEADLGESMRGPMAHPRPGARRLLFGGLTRSTSASDVPAFPPNSPGGAFGGQVGQACYCMLRDAKEGIPIETVG